MKLSSAFSHLGDVRVAPPGPNYFRGSNSNMVAKSASTLSPNARVFVPKDPRSYAQATKNEAWVPHSEGWSTKPLRKPNQKASSNLRNKMGPKTRPQSRQQTMPYKYYATQQVGPYETYGHGSRISAPNNKRTRRTKKHYNKKYDTKKYLLRK